MNKNEAICWICKEAKIAKTALINEFGSLRKAENQKSSNIYDWIVEEFGCNVTSKENEHIVTNIHGYNLISKSNFIFQQTELNTAIISLFSKNKYNITCQNEKGDIIFQCNGFEIHLNRIKDNNEFYITSHKEVKFEKNTLKLYFTLAKYVEYNNIEDVAKNINKTFDELIKQEHNHIIELNVKCFNLYEKFVTQTQLCKNDNDCYRIIKTFNQTFSSFVSINYDPISYDELETLIKKMTIYESKKKNLVLSFQDLLKQIQTFNESEEAKLYEEYKSIKENIVMDTLKEKYNKCIEEIKKRAELKIKVEPILSLPEISKLLKLAKENNLLKVFAEIWIVESVDEFLSKHDNLENQYIQVAKSLYNVCSEERKLILLENEIYS